LAYDGIETAVPEWQCLAVSGYWPKQRFVQTGTRTFEHRGRNVRTDHESRRAYDRERDHRGLTRSGGDIEHSVPRR
jgi:hypothetical protein